MQAALDRYFDRNSRRVVAASELVQQVPAQARLVTVPRPDETLAALAAAAGAVAHRCGPSSGSSCCSCVAVVAASTLGANDGLVTFFWRGWRLDLSLNLFVVGLLVTCFVLVSAFQAVQCAVELAGAGA